MVIHLFEIHVHWISGTKKIQIFSGREPLLRLVPYFFIFHFYLDADLSMYALSIAKSRAANDCERLDANASHLFEIPAPCRFASCIGDSSSVSRSLRPCTPNNCDGCLSFCRVDGVYTRRRACPSQRELAGSARSRPTNCTPTSPGSREVMTGTDTTFRLRSNYLSPTGGLAAEMPRGNAPGRVVFMKPIDAGYRISSTSYIPTSRDRANPPSEARLIRNPINTSPFGFSGRRSKFYPENIILSTRMPNELPFRAEARPRIRLSAEIGIDFNGGILRR